MLESAISRRINCEWCGFQGKLGNWCLCAVFSPKFDAPAREAIDGLAGGMDYELQIGAGTDLMVGSCCNDCSEHLHTSLRKDTAVGREGTGRDITVVLNVSRDGALGHGSFWL